MRPVTKITIFGVRLGVAVLVIYWLMLFVGTHLPGGSGLNPPGNDKVQHFAAFFLLGILFCYATTSPRLPLRFATIGVVGMAYAAVDEMTQRFVPGRYPDVRDLVADSIGLWSGIAVYVTARFILGFFRPPSN